MQRQRMSFSPQLKNSEDYSIYGFEPVEKAKTEEKKPEDTKPDYSSFGFEPVEKPKEKIGKLKSALYGAAEGILGIPSLLQYGVNEFSKALEPGEPANLTNEQENPIGSYIGSFPESEDEASRRIRTGTAGVVGGAPFGIPGIIAGLVGSQAGQTIREIYGKDGKFENFGWGEGAALGADVLAGMGTGIATSLTRGAGRAATSQANRVPSIFQNAETGLQRAVVKNAIQGERSALDNVVNNFSQNQVRGFEQQVSQIAPDRYTQLVNSNSSGLKQQADNMFRNTQLNIISPIAATPEQGARAIQEAANATFTSEVIGAERQAYGAAREAAKDLSGEAPRTIHQAKTLRNDLLKNNPTPEQQPVINFLTGLIEDLETNVAASTSPASKLLDASGKPLIAAVENAASSTPTVRSANDLVDLVQRSNQAVNYGSELRHQSHRLTPIVNTLRQEVGSVLNTNTQASQLYQHANALHGHNAQTWGTRFMRSLRFAENPETIVGKTKLASNMRNLKTGIADLTIQGLAERLVVGQMTEGGSSSANRTALAKLSPELSQNARNASTELVNVKDPLTTTGGRAAVRNDILKDAAQSVNTGKRPEKILDLMQTPKGYGIIRESLNGSPESRRLFSSFERLFVEDIFNSITDKTGMIDFTKARNIIKNGDVRSVVQSIGGDRLVTQFSQLERYANNFERNLDLFKKPEVQTLFRKIVGETANAGVIAAVMHSLHVPMEVIAGLGLMKGLAIAGKVTYNSLQSKILNNPRAVTILESISRANSTQELAKQVPRFLAEIEKSNESE